MDLSIAESARDCARFLLQISPQDRLTRALNAYERLFNERYGVRKVVPLTELASRRGGLGLPSEILRDSADDWDTAYIRFVGNIWALGMKNGGEVDLGPGEVAELLSQSRPRQHWPESLDINISVENTSSSFNQKPPFRLHIAPYPGCIGAGRHMARFIPLLGDSAGRLQREIVIAEGCAGDENRWATLVFAPLKERLINVIAAPKAESLIVSDCAPPDHLSPQELGLVYAADKLRIVSLRDGEELRVRCQHMVNVRYAPRLYRLMLEISNGYSRRLARFDWGPLRVAVRHPRVLYRGCVVSPARWQIDASALRTSESVLTAQRTHEVPDHIYIGGEDSRLLLNLKSEAHRAEVARFASKSRAMIEIDEAVDPQRLAMLQSVSGKHCTELVVSMALEPGCQQKPLAHKYLISKARTFVPGSEWIYLRIASAEETEERFITTAIFSLVTSHLSLIDRWFFVRYSYPNRHIRLRAKASQGNADRLLSGFIASMRAIVSDRYTSEFNVETYQPEEDRFGGAAFFDRTASVFQADSEAAVSIFNYVDRHHKIARVIAGIRLARILLSSAGLDDNEQVRAVRASTESRTAGMTWRECQNDARNTILGLCDSSPVDEAYLRYEERCRRVFTSEWADVVRRDERIIRDLLHMQANRIYGPDRSLEALRNEILARAIVSVNKLRTETSALR